MAFEPVNIKTPRGESFITIDKYERIVLSTAARKQLGISDLMSPWISVWYDKETHRIAIQKEELVKFAPAETKVKVGKRGYFHAKGLVESAAIDKTRLPVRYYFDGTVSIQGHSFLAFKLEEL